MSENRPRQFQTSAGTTLYLPQDRAGGGDKQGKNNVAGALAKLRDLAAVVDGYLETAVPGSVDLGSLDETDHRIIDEALGEGEVSLVVNGSVRIEVQEATMAGLWRIRTYDGHERRSGAFVEVAPFPSLARRALDDQCRSQIDVDTHIDVGAGGAMHAIPILAELRARADAYRPGDESHAITLSNLPMTPEDLGLVIETLGDGPVEAFSRGYSACRIASTACRHVWRVMYLNADAKLLVHMIEVVDVPSAVLATEEDMRDGARALAEMIAVYAQ